MHRLAFIIATALIAAVPVAATAVTVNFDDVAAPSNFINAKPLVAQYASLGVVFAGHGAVLDNSIADFGISGQSAPNVVGYVNAQQFTGSVRQAETADTIRFSLPQTLVRFDVGSGTSALALDVQTFDAAGALLGDQSITLGAALQTVTLGGGFTSLAFNLVGATESSAFAIDNLNFTQGPAILPAPEPAAIGLLVVGVGATLGLRRRKRI